MTRDEAKHILQSCRAGSTEDFNDLLFADALALLESDSELRAWWDDQCRFDAIFVSELRRIPVPEDLKTTICSGMRAELLQDLPVPEPDNTIAFPAKQAGKRPHYFSWMGVAASILLAAAALIIISGQGQKQGEVAHAGVPDVLTFVNNQLRSMSPARFDRVHSDGDVLRKHLQQLGVPAPHRIPARLVPFDSMGCLAMDFEGKTLSMICFKTDSGSAFHLITGHRSDFSDLAVELPRTYQTGDTVHRIWFEGDFILIVTGKGSKDTLDVLLSELPNPPS